MVSLAKFEIFFLHLSRIASNDQNLISGVFGSFPEVVQCHQGFAVTTARLRCLKLLVGRTASADGFQ